jgi:hypothetical protein
MLIETTSASKDHISLRSGELKDINTTPRAGIINTSLFSTVCVV